MKQWEIRGLQVLVGERGGGDGIFVMTIWAGKGGGGV